MEKYLKAVSEMYSQFNQREVHPMEKYIGRLANLSGEKVEVVGYRDDESAFPLIVDASKAEGWCCAFLDQHDIVTKECEIYRYASIDELID